MNSPKQRTATTNITSLSSCTEHRLTSQSYSLIAFEKPAKCPVPSILLEGYGRDGDRLLSGVHRRRTKGNEHKMEGRKICLDIRRSVFTTRGAG